MTREGMLTFDKATGRRLEAMSSTSDVIERRRTAMEAVAPRAGDHGLDIGPGPGFIACELAERVGPARHIAAVDTNAAMLEMTRRRAEKRGLIDRLDLMVEIERRAANGGFFFSLNQYCFRATLGPQPWPSTGTIIR